MIFELLKALIVPYYKDPLLTDEPACALTVGGVVNYY